MEVGGRWFIFFLSGGSQAFHLADHLVCKTKSNVLPTFFIINMYVELFLIENHSSFPGRQGTVRILCIGLKTLNEHFLGSFF